MSTKERNVDLAKWSGPKRPYDLLKGLAIALVPLTLIIVTCALAFGSPDVPAITLQDWAQAEPTDFVMTAVGELAGTTESSTYGAPYNNGSDGQVLGPLKLQKFFGVRIPINPANDFVVEPLRSSIETGTYAALEQWTGTSTAQQKKLVAEYLATQNSGLTAALKQWTGASTEQQSEWTQWYKVALDKTGNPSKVAADAAYGPVQSMSASLLALAQSGVLDGILTTQSNPYPSNFTKPLLFLADGKYLGELAGAQHLDGRLTSLVNETGSYPGQFWLLPTTFLYHIEPFKSSKNANAEAFAIRLLLALVLIYLPKIPVLNQIPQWIPLHRIIWRRYYRKNDL